MKKILLILLLLFGISGNVWGLPYTGSISIGDGLFGSASWGSQGAELSWEVTYDLATYLWIYNYTFTVSNKSPSHEILEVSSGDKVFTAANLIGYTNIDGAEDPPELGDFSPGGSNPYMPGPIYGIKWDSPGEGFSDTWTIVTDRAPMWGDFYAKDGEDKDYDPSDLFAYNTGFGHDTVAAIANGNAYDALNNWAWVLVPDSVSIPPQEVVPEPGTLLLMGGGLLGVAFFGRRRFRS